MSGFNFEAGLENLQKSMQLIDSGTKRKNATHAILINNVISKKGDLLEDAIIVFKNGVLSITSMESSASIYIDEDDFLQIVAFALDNGLELPEKKG